MHINTHGIFKYGSRQGVVAVTLEPLAGHTDSEVIGALKSVGAEGIELIAPGFIVADANIDLLQGLSLVARVHIDSGLHPPKIGIL